MHTNTVWTVLKPRQGASRALELEIGGTKHVNAHTNASITFMQYIVQIPSRVTFADIEYVDQ